MNSSKIFLIATLLLGICSNAQIVKGNWMMGGSASFYNSKNTAGDTGNSSTGFSLSPKVGYFVIDKLAIGTLGQFSYDFTNENTKSGYSYTVAPFVRYYFLEKEKPINIFSEVSYDILRASNTNYKTDNLNLKAGGVFFLNSSIGLEVALNYFKQKNTGDYPSQIRIIYLSVGFQIHLEREK
jgi:hypothetical protein